MEVSERLDEPMMWSGLARPQRRPEAACPGLVLCRFESENGIEAHALRYMIAAPVLTFEELIA
jgi:hypothetical protein